jgi:hypothetical protein
VKRSNKSLPKDPNLLAFTIVKMHTEEPAKPEQPKERSAISQYLAEIGRRGGLKGGKARAKKLTPERRKEIALKAANSRWPKK